MTDAYTDWLTYVRFRCDTCGTIGTADDLCRPGGDCPDEDCYGTVFPLGRFYIHEEDTGMERWHDGVETAEQCHDGVGLITRYTVSLDDFLFRYPTADWIEED